jgi:hypothetical protein
MPGNMNRVALKILNDILSAAPPGATVCLPLEKALKLAELGARELGEELKTCIEQTSAAEALQSQGLFGREIRIINNRVNVTMNR